MHVLYLSTRYCWPPRSGSHLRDFHLARQIASWARLTYVGLDSEGLPPGESQRRERVAVLRDAEVIRIRREPGYSRFNLVRGFVGPKPISVLNYTSPAMMSAVEQVLREQPVDAVQVESVHLIAYAERVRQLVPGVPLLCDWHNIESEILERYAENCASTPRRIYARRTAVLLRGFERRYLRMGNANTICSERERQVLLGLEPSASIEVIENGLDLDYLSQSDSAPTGPRRNLVYVGLMEYHANVDAVSYFAREVWPSVRQRRPELQFVIVGARPTRDLDLAAKAMAAAVADVREPECEDQDVGRHGDAPNDEPGGQVRGEAVAGVRDGALLLDAEGARNQAFGRMPVPDHE